MDKLPINFSLMANPMNWLTVLLMVAIAAFAFHLLLPTYYDKFITNQKQG